MFRASRCERAALSGEQSVCFVRFFNKRACCAHADVVVQTCNDDDDDDDDRAERRMNAVAKCNLFGVGCTASLATHKHKHGDHRCFVAVSSNKGISTYSLVLQKGVLAGWLVGWSVGVCVDSFDRGDLMGVALASSVCVCVCACVCRC